MTKITMQAAPPSDTPPVDSPAMPEADDDGPVSSRGPSPAGGAGEPQPCTDPTEALEQLNIELGQLRESKADIALFKAHARKAELIDDEHKKAFLHTENYVVKAAADRMMSYWEASSDLFGNEGMLRDMHNSGSLKDEDVVALHQGVLQLLPQRDLDGRALIYYDPSRLDTKYDVSSESMLRVLWYIMHVAMQDPATRENGFVLIVYPKKCIPEQIDRDVIAKGVAIVGQVLPLPWKGFHICHPCSSYNKYFPLVKMLSPASIKDNIAVHFGTEEHVLQCLASYSVPAERLPKEFGGSEELNYKRWLADRMKEEGDDALKAPMPQPDLPSERGESADEIMEDVLSSETGENSESGVKAKPRKKKKKADKKVAAAAAAGRSSSALSSAESSVASASLAPDAEDSKVSPPGKKKRPGRKGDTRMHQAVTLKMENPEISLVEALQDGGFAFEGLNEKGKPHHEVFDQDGVSLMQRKNQLLRRIRVEKKKKSDMATA